MRHALAVVLVVGFLLLGWWQVNRAAQGNMLSWAYAVEWPVFALFVVFVWVKEVRRELRPESSPEQPEQDVQSADGSSGEPYRAEPDTLDGILDRPVVTVRTPVEATADDDEQLAAYNRYLAWLNEHPGASRSDYPG